MFFISGASFVPTLHLPFDTAISVAVSTSPPKTFALLISSCPTDSGPTEIFSVFIKEPPPSPKLITSGIEKFVLTSATVTEVPACRGKPSFTSPTSVVVPPTSTTSAFFSLDRKAAPRIELVGPHAKVRTGRSSTSEDLISVPSFLVKKIGHLNFILLRSSSNEFTTSFASGFKVALIRAAFSLSNNPIPPIFLLSETFVFGEFAFIILKASSSMSPLTVAKTELIAI